MPHTTLCVKTACCTSIMLYGADGISAKWTMASGWNASAACHRACSSSSIASQAEKRGLKPLAKIVAHTTHAHEPNWFTTAPVGALKKLFAKSSWQPKDVDLFEINEAFAVVTMAAMRELDLPHDKVNVHGGACALGHPIGASGARVLTTVSGCFVGPAPTGVTVTRTDRKRDDARP